MLKRLTTVFTLIFILLLSNAYADIPQTRKAQSKDQFYGLWNFENVFFENIQQGMPVQQIMGSSCTLGLYPYHCYEFNSEGCLYLSCMEFKDGKVNVKENEVTFTFYATDDSNYLLCELESSGIKITAKRVSDPQYQDFEYKKYMRNPQNYVGKFMKVTGTVFMTSGERKADSFYQVVLCADDGVNQLVFIQFMNNPSYNLLYNDEVTVYGIAEGTHVSDSSVPLIIAYDVSLIE